MIKIRLVLLFAFIFLNTTAQNPYSQGIESLKIIRDNINIKVYEESPEEYSKLVDQFKKKLDSIIERNKQIKKKKNIK